MSSPTTTLMPFAQLPACAQNCGVLFDANGACVPPAAPETNEATYENCFCSFGALQPWKSGPTGVCEYANCDAAGFSSIQGWFTSMCNAVEGVTQTSSSSSATGSSGSSRGSSGSSNSGNGGDWLSNHWRWVVMLVILVVAIAGIWVGACIWRRRYLRRKDRMYELGKHAHKGPSGIIAGSGVNVNQQGLHSEPGSFMPGPPAAVYEEKPSKEKKRWIVNQRT
ncbi:integral membrane protein [Colletotrichum plurivorum]|uniref:Integral membrane protein n=1 Tax=Colletotrichum plurivorum TaxID=2175906 RepID=A0A8H6N7K4_9PEZI|nr:integral membrane protein [Colletotrichum plurivorum]